MSEEKQSQFEGWAAVELFGHQKEVGYVTTQHYGQAALFQIDVPGVPEQEVVLERPEYGPDGQWLPRGAKVVRSAREGRTRLVGPGAIYAINPCTEAAAMKLIENGGQRIVKVVDVPSEMKALPEPDQDDDDSSEDDEDDDTRGLF